MSWQQDSEYAAQVIAYNTGKGATNSSLLSSFDGLFPDVSIDDPCRNLNAHIFAAPTPSYVDGDTEHNGVISDEAAAATPSDDASAVVVKSTATLTPLQAYISMRLDPASKNIDVSRTVMEIRSEDKKEGDISSSTDDAFDSLRGTHTARKYVAIGSMVLSTTIPATTTTTCESTSSSTSPPPPSSIVSILAPVGDRDGIHRAIRETSSCGYETILFASNSSSAAVSVPALLFTITSCLSKNNSSGAFIFIERNGTSSGDKTSSNFTGALMSQAAFFGLNYYVVDKGIMTTTTTTASSIRVIKLTHRMDAAGPSMACSIPLNQHIEDRQRFGVPTRDADEAEEEFKQRQTTYAQAKREFQRKFLLTHSHPVVPPPPQASSSIDGPADSPGNNYYPVFDVVVQGMGLVEALLVVALARSGKRVLHVCGDDHYGSAFASTDLFSFHRDYILNTKDSNPPSNRGALQSIQLFEDKVFSTSTTTPTTTTTSTDDSAPIPPPSHVAVTDREKRQFIIDLFPMFHFSRSDLFNLLVDSRVSPSMDMMLVDRVLLLSSTKKAESGEIISGDTPKSSSANNQQPVKLTARERLAKLRQQKEAATKNASGDAPEEVPTPVAPTATVAPTSSTTMRSSSSSLSVEPIPFSRADVFRQQSSTATASAPTSALGKLAAAATTASLGLMEMRKLMKFIRDLERYMSEQGGFGGEDCDSGDEDALQARIGESKATSTKNDDASKLPWQRSTQDPHEEIGVFLERVYGLAEHTRQLLLLGGTISNKQPSSPSSPSSSATTVTHAINSLALAFSSVGRFEGLATPFLVPLYGTGELVQTLCTRSASWLSTTILRRCIKRISTTTTSTNSDSTMTTVELSNGERVLTKAVVVPNGLLPSSANPQQQQPKYHRAVLVLSSPFVSWKQLEARCNDGLSHVDDAEQRAQAEQVRDSALFPTSVSILPISGGNVLIYQLGMSSEHCPYAFQKAEDRDEGSVPCLVHFLADACTTSRADFDAAVESCIVVGGSGGAVTDRPVGIPKESILYRTHFTLDNEASVRCGGGEAQGYCVVEGTHDEKEAVSASSIFSVPTMFNGSSAGEDISSASTTPSPFTLPKNVVMPTIHTPNPAMCILDDGWYAHTAENAYHAIQRYLVASTQQQHNVDSETKESTASDDNAAALLLQHSYMPFFEEFPDPGDRWYAGYDASEKKPTQLREDGEDCDEEDDDDIMEGADVGGDGLGYEDRTLQLLREQKPRD